MAAAPSGRGLLDECQQQRGRGFDLQSQPPRGDDGGKVAEAIHHPLRYPGRAACVEHVDVVVAVGEPWQPIVGGDQRLVVERARFASADLDATGRGSYARPP